MLRSLNTATSGMRQFQDEMDVIGNNIANVNTTGFKSARVEFADAFSQTLRGSSPAIGGNSSVSAMQIGSGVGMAGIRNLYTQGAIERTGVPSDLAVVGQGYFVVRDTVSNASFATRAGDFRIDESGYLITHGGQRVQGYSDAARTTIGDIQIDGTGRVLGEKDKADATVASYGIDEQGQVTVTMTDSSSFVRGQVLLQNFRNPDALMKQGNNLYSNLDVAGGLNWQTTPGVAGTAGLGKIQAGSLEMSNVDLATEFTNLITTQRAYQANARIITTSDELLQEAVNLKR